MTIPTQTPIPSGLAQDFRFNVEKVDEEVNSTDLYYTDRFGVRRLTNDGRNKIFNDKLLGMGWQEMGNFAPGIVINNRSQIVFWNGSWYQFIGPLPYVTTTNNPNTDGGIFSEANPNGLWVNLGVDLSLRSDLAGDGAKFVSNAVAHFDTCFNINASMLRDGMVVIAKGRSAVNDGGGGTFRYDQNSTAATDNGIVFSVTGGGRIIRQVETNLSENQISESINVRWFGARGDGATDDTASILAAYNYAKNTGLFYDLLFPMGRYVTRSTFLFENAYMCSFTMHGAIFIGASTGVDNSQDAVFQIHNAINFDIRGTWSVTAAAQSGSASGNANAYVSGFFLKCSPGFGGPLGNVQFVNIDGLTTIRIGNGVRVGEVNNDGPTSELNFNGLKTPFTVNPIFIAGSQTLVSFTGCTIAANNIYPSVDVTNAAKRTLIMQGGAATFVGGSFENHLTSTDFAIEMQPCVSSQYKNPYGQVSITGATMEVVCPLLAVSNPYSVPSPASYTGRFGVFNCTGGYIGEVGNQAFINVFDTSWAGTISIPDGTSFYATLTSPANSTPQVNCAGSSVAKVILGKTVFRTDTGFLAWPAVVAGGHLVHSEVQALSATVSSQSIPASSTTVVRFDTNPIDNVRMGRYQYILNTATGAITCPDAGVRRVRIESSLAISSTFAAGNIMIYRGGTLYAYGILYAGSGVVSASIPDPVAGETYTVMLNINESVSITTSRLNVFLET